MVGERDETEAMYVTDTEKQKRSREEETIFLKMKLHSYITIWFLVTQITISVFNL